MLRLSTQNSRLAHLYGYEESIRMISEAGFETYDMTFACMDRCRDPFQQEDWKESAHKIRTFADRINLPCTQAHAPFPSAKGDEDDIYRFEQIIRSMEIASILGAEIIVVHPIHVLYHMEHFAENKALNMEFYRRLEPYCEKFNIKIALENMFQHSPYCYDRRVDSTCSRMEEFCDYLDTLNSPWFVACLDLGHVPLVGESLPRMIHGLASRLQALHIHDNDIQRDSHTLPFQGRINFDEVTQALADINYSGELTLEADNFYIRYPAEYKELYQAAAHFMCQTTHTLRKMIEAKRTQKTV